MRARIKLFGEATLIKCDLDRDKEILIVRPQGALEIGDFQAVARAVDPYISEKGELTGLLIEAPSFPGWDSFAALVEHIKVVRETITDTSGASLP